MFYTDLLRRKLKKRQVEVNFSHGSKKKSLSKLRTAIEQHALSSSVSSCTGSKIEKPRFDALHALATGTGNCQEFATLSAYLLAGSDTRKPIGIAYTGKHVFCLLGDHREGDITIIVDPWVTYPVPHVYFRSTMKDLPITNLWWAERRGIHDPKYQLAWEDVHQIYLDYYLSYKTPSMNRTQVAQEWVKPDLLKKDKNKRVIYQETSHILNYEDRYNLEFNEKTVPWFYREKMKHGRALTEKLVRPFLKQSSSR